MTSFYGGVSGAAHSGVTAADLMRLVSSSMEEVRALRLELQASLEEVRRTARLLERWRLKQQEPE